MEMSLRFEIFPRDLDATVDFYTQVLGFTLIGDQRREAAAYVSLQRGDVRVGAARRDVPDGLPARRPPAGVEIVLEVADVAGERDRVVAAGWPLDEDLRERPWGMSDFRILDPSGYYLRITAEPLTAEPLTAEPRREPGP
jgi:catechol 2,3-dioxygenase-like lactoylglutathione lyase family enzyme